MHHRVLNGLLFNVSWLAIVASQSSSLALIVAVIHVCVHLYLMGRGKPEWILIFAVLLGGLTLDHLLFTLGLFTINGALGAAPIWLSCLWPVLATTLMHCFSPLQQRLPLAAALGAIGGTLSYIAGTRMSTVDFFSPLAGPAMIAVLWACLFPLLTYSAYRLQSWGQRPGLAL